MAQYRKRGDQIIHISCHQSIHIVQCHYCSTVYNARGLNSQHLLL